MNFLDTTSSPTPSCGGKPGYQPHGSPTIAMALFRVAHPDQWTGLEADLIRLESTMAHQQGWLHRLDATLALFVPLEVEASSGLAPEDPADRLELALRYIEHLAALLEQQGGSATVFSVGPGMIGALGLSRDAQEEAETQLRSVTGPGLFLHERLLALLPLQRRQQYHRTASSLPGFRQRRAIPASSWSFTPVYERLIRVQDLIRWCWHRINATLRWRPILLAIPGLAMFLMAPYFMRIPAASPARPGPSTNDDVMDSSQGGIEAMSSPHLDPALPSGEPTRRGPRATAATERPAPAAAASIVQGIDASAKAGSSAIPVQESPPCRSTSQTGGCEDVRVEGPPAPSTSLASPLR